MPPAIPTADRAPLAADTFDHNVSVIVLNFNHADTTIQCLDALQRAASALIKEIIVVDNGSDYEEVAVLRRHTTTRDFRLVEVGENRFFSEGNNIGVDFARGDFIVFLNNDAFVEPGWIEELAATLQHDPTVAAVGPMFLYPDSRVQEVGSLALPTGDVVQVGKGSVWGADHYDTPCVVDFCSAACLLMRRSDFLEVGGFGFEWEPAYYEDADLCLKLWNACGKVMVNPRARVVHIESKTTSDSRLHLDDISEINRQRFARKWGPWLEARQTRHLAGRATDTTPNDAPGGHSVAAVETHSEFVLFSPYDLVPGGGERVMFELASHFSSLVGPSQVTFCTPSRYSSVRMRQISNAFGFENAVATARPWDEVDRSRSRFSVVLGNSIIPPVAAFGRRCVYQMQFPFYMSDEDITANAKMLADYDEIWVYSDFVRRHVKALLRHYDLPSIPIRVISPPATWPGAGDGLPWADRRTILTVGRFFAGGHNKRQDVVIDAFRQVLENGRHGFELAVAGSIHPGPEGRKRYHELRAMAEGLPCTFHPNVSRADLATLYERSAVLVHAAGYGVDPDEFPESLEHFGITPVEASSFGCIPVVYGQGGPLDVIDVLGCDTAFQTIDGCARAVEQLLGDPVASSALSARVRERCQAFSPDAFRGRIDQALRDLDA
jgi:GT2 family glycosyltransferase/glycosyltransferase involved in cell wall biosynthesis